MLKGRKTPLNRHFSPFFIYPTVKNGNIPLGVLCFRSIGKKFVFFSILQVILLSIFLNFHYTLLFDDLLLNVCFGGFLYGIAISLALRGN
ncbi:YitT family protein, partial [Sharpea azabuensis]|uniref:YitT family protein n=1 Tax=Sharpea azabuensis TaxID=322505 RepID=UPI0039B79585